MGGLCIISNEYIPKVAALEIPSYFDEDFELNEKYSYILNLTDKNLVLFNIKTKENPFIINITRTNDTHIENIKYSNSYLDSYWKHQFIGQINIFSLNENSTEYNITVINDGSSNDILDFSLKIYQKTPELINEISEDIDFIVTWIIGIVIAIIQLVFIVFSRKIATLKPPSKRKYYLKRFGIIIICSICIFFFGEIYFLYSVKSQSINSNIGELEINNGFGIFNFPITELERNSIIFEWTVSYSSEDEGLFHKTIELINLDDNNYTFSIYHNVSSSSKAQIISNFTRLIIPNGHYIILGGNNTNIYYSNIISNQSIDSISAFIFTFDNFITIISLIYYVTTYKFKIKVHK